jgi:insulysin
MFRVHLVAVTFFILIDPPLLAFQIYQKTFSLRSKVRSDPLFITSAGQNENETDAISRGDVELNDFRRRQLVSMLLGSITTTLKLDNPSNAVNVDVSELGEDILNIIKPPLDECEYVAYTLANGLRVLLCSDPSPSFEAAAAMDVHVGACSDPGYLPGLAHFLEHMIFLGTKMYPKEDSFGEFLSVNGGSSNAYTDSENTVYFFSVNAEADEKLREALSRFGSFFSCPLFTEAATGRELNAIESENAKNLQSDIFREFQIFKSRANSDHPFSKFFTGNKKTLLEGTKELGIDLRTELIKFYNEYYSANQMTLAIVAPQPIRVMKKIIAECFLDVPNRSIPKPEETWSGISPFLNDNSQIPSFQHFVEIVPVSDLRQVQIAWPIVYRSELDRQASQLIKPSQYIAHLLGHEGPHSLLSFLKKRGWANTLGSSTSEVLSDFETFEIVVGLTSKGLASVDKVIEAIYSFIKFLQTKTIPDFVFKEVLQLAELQWRFLTKNGLGECKFDVLDIKNNLIPNTYMLTKSEYFVKTLLHSVPQCKTTLQHYMWQDRGALLLMNLP